MKDFVFTQGRNHFYTELNFFNEIKRIAHIENREILDIGCGEGRLLTIFNLFGKAELCCGIDPADGKGSSMSVLDVFKKNNNALGLKNIKIIQDDFLIHDFGEMEFDIITAIDSIHHIINTKENILKNQKVNFQFNTLFKKIYNLLTSKGIFVLYDCSKFTLRHYCKSFYNLTKSNVNFKTKHTSREYSRILRKVGFKDLYLKYYLRSYYLNKFKLLFSNPITTFPIDSHYFIFSIK